MAHSVAVHQRNDIPLPTKHVVLSHLFSRSVLQIEKSRGSLRVASIFGTGFIHRHYRGRLLKRNLDPVVYICGPQPGLYHNVGQRIWIPWPAS